MNSSITKGWPSIVLLWRGQPGFYKQMQDSYHFANAIGESCHSRCVFASCFFCSSTNAFIWWIVNIFSISASLGDFRFRGALCTSTCSESLKSKVLEDMQMNHPVGDLGNHFTRSRSSNLLSLAMALTAVVTSSGVFSLRQRLDRCWMGSEGFI